MRREMPPTDAVSGPMPNFLLSMGLIPRLTTSRWTSEIIEDFPIHEIFRIHIA